MFCCPCLGQAFRANRLDQTFWENIDQWQLQVTTAAFARNDGGVRCICWDTTWGLCERV